ncbi:MAG: lipoprotein [Alistipes indistinctus]
MKKSLMALAAAAILAGCSKNEQENVDGFTPKQIKFTNLNDKLTRAANDVGNGFFTGLMRPGVAGQAGLSTIR